MVSCCKYKRGDLRTLVTIKQQTRTQIAGGGYDIDYDTTRFTARCKFESLSGNEVFKTNRTDAQSRHKMLMTYNSALVESDIAIVNSKKYNITFIDNVEQRNRWMIVYVDGGVPV